MTTGSKESFDMQSIHTNYLETIAENTAAVKQAAIAISNALGTPKSSNTVPDYYSSSSTPPPRRFFESNNEIGTNQSKPLPFDLLKKMPVADERKTKKVSSSIKQGQKSDSKVSTKKLKKRNSNLSIPTEPSSIRKSTTQENHRVEKTIIPTKSTLNTENQNTFDIQKTMISTDVLVMLRSQLLEASEAGRLNKLKLDAVQEELMISHERETKLQCKLEETQRNLAKTSNKLENEVLIQRQESKESLRQKEKSWKAIVRGLELELYKEKLNFAAQTKFLEDSSTKLNGRVYGLEKRLQLEKEKKAIDLLDQAVTLESIELEHVGKERERKRYAELYKTASEKINVTSHKLDKLSERLKVSLLA